MRQLTQQLHAATLTPFSAHPNLGNSTSPQNKHQPEIMAETLETAAAEAKHKELLKKYPSMKSNLLTSQISDSHSRKLRDAMHDWKRFMLELGLSEEELRLIDLQEPQETMKRLIAMRKWRKKMGQKATYGFFMDACMRVGEEELAEKMMQLLHSQKEDTVISPRHSPRRLPEVPLRDRISALERSFLTLADLLSNHFYSVPHELIIEFLLNSVPDDLAQTPEYRHITLIDDADKLAELVRVTDLWHTDLLGLLVKEFGSEECSEAMDTYLAKVATFYSNATIEECRMEEWEVRDWEQDDIKAIEFQLASNWDEQRTLQDLNEFRLKLQRRAGYEKYELRLQGVADMCTFVLVTESAQLGRLKNIHNEFFRTNNILRVTTAGKTIYHVESPKNYKATAAIPPHYMCPISKQIMLDPHKTSCCGKHLSRAAINASDHNEDDELVCPVCSISPMEAKRDSLLKDRTQTLKIYCPYKYEGCHWNGEIRLLKAHWSDPKTPCRFTTVPCPKLCGKKVQQYYLEQHTRKCSYQNRCKVCGKKSERGTTYCDNCQESMTPCPYKCGDVIRPVDMLRHFKRCKTLSVTTSKDEIDANDDQDSDQQEDNYTFLDIAKQLQEKRLQSHEIRCQLMNNAVSLLEVQNDQKSEEQVKKAKQEWRERESTLLARDDQTQQEMHELRSRLDKEIKERKKKFKNAFLH